MPDLPHFGYGVPAHEDHARNVDPEVSVPRGHVDPSRIAHRAADADYV